MNRLVMIDGLRGLGALSIALYHIFRYGPLPDAAGDVMPDSVSAMITNGWMAVQWFFVIAGFSAVLASRSQDATTAYGAAQQVMRRVLRLGAAYWIALSLASLLTIMAIWLWNDYTLNDAPPTLAQFVAHIFFLQDVLGYDSLSTGFWFIAIALQLDVAFVMLMWASGHLSRWLERRRVGSSLQVARAVCFGPLALWSLMWSIHDTATDIWFHHFFCMFMLGVLLGWVANQQIHVSWFWGYVALMVVQLRWHFTLELSIALIAGLTLYAGWCTGAIHTLLRWQWLQYLGVISYSLFLVHYPVSWLVGRVGFWLTGAHPIGALFWLLLGLVASIAVAHLLYNLVERPVQRRTKNLNLRWSMMWPVRTTAQRT